MAGRAIDLNCDMGEGFGAWPPQPDEKLMPLVSSANVACGFHASDPRLMRRTVRLAREHGVGVGAHPSFPDLVGFGRRMLAATPEEIQDDVVYQVGALLGFCRAEGVPLVHVKPHGALYNAAAKDAAIARANRRRGPRGGPLAVADGSRGLPPRARGARRRPALRRGGVRGSRLRARRHAPAARPARRDRSSIRRWSPSAWRGSRSRVSSAPATGRT